MSLHRKRQKTNLEKTKDKTPLPQFCLLTNPEYDAIIILFRSLRNIMIDSLSVKCERQRSKVSVVSDAVKYKCSGTVVQWQDEGT